MSWSASGDKAALRIAVARSSRAFYKRYNTDVRAKMLAQILKMPGAALGVVPVIGTAIDGYHLYYDIKSRNYVAAGVDGALLLVSLAPGAKIAFKGVLKHGKGSAKTAEETLAAANKTATRVADDWVPPTSAPKGGGGVFRLLNGILGHRQRAIPRMRMAQLPTRQQGKYTRPFVTALGMFALQMVERFWGA